MIEELKQLLDKCGISYSHKNGRLDIDCSNLENMHNFKNEWKVFNEKSKGVLEHRGEIYPIDVNGSICHWSVIEKV